MPEAPRTREVAFDEVPARDLREGLTEGFKRLALEASSPQAVALDLGSGEGRVALFLAPHVRRVVGVDGDARAVERAKRRARALGLANVEFHLGDVEREAPARWVPGGCELVVSHLLLGKALVERAHDALRPGGAFVFTGYGPRQWEEARGSPLARSEPEVRAWLEAAHLKPEALALEDVRIRFRDLSEVRAYLGDEEVARWQREGRWDALVEAFAKARVLTESRITGRARR